MFRIKLAMIVGGGFIAFMGYEQFKVSSGTTAEPVSVSLADLEAGKIPDNAHLNIGEHIALHGCI